MTYVWKCDRCNSKVEVTASIDDRNIPPSIDVCPGCTAALWTRVIEAPSIKTGDGFKV